MATCLIALGSNLGDRAATLQAALNALGKLPGTHLVRSSRWYAYPAIGGPVGQPEFLNAAALVETQSSPQALFAQLLEIEQHFGRRRDKRWAARTLDLDLALYADLVLETDSLVVPHPRMSFRRFVLEPAAEIAGEMIHPTISFRIEHLLLHLNMTPNWAAIVSPDHAERRELCELAIARFGAKIVAPPDLRYSRNAALYVQLWPPNISTWLEFPSPPQKPFGAIARPEKKLILVANLPKLTVLIDPPPSSDEDDGPNEWPTIRDLAGRGPTLVIRAADRHRAAEELSAAIEAVWPHLGRNVASCVELLGHG